MVVKNSREIVGAKGVYAFEGEFIKKNQPRTFMLVQFQAEGKLIFAFKNSVPTPGAFKTTTILKHKTYTSPSSISQV